MVTLHVVCPNPALDRIQLVGELVPFSVNRVIDVKSLPGGKGMIVCRGATRLGASVTAHGFVGGGVGEIIRHGCVELGVDDRHVAIDGDTRITPVVIERSSGRSTVFNERGPEVTEDDVAHLLAGLESAVQPGDVVVTTGSLPPGCPGNFHATVVRLAVRLGARPLVDAHGVALVEVIDDLAADPVSGLIVLKPNAEELADALGGAFDPDDAHATVAEMADLGDRTGATVVVTRGASGSVWLGSAEEIVATAPRVATVNPTGSGDSFLAGLAVSLGRGESPAQAMRLGSAMGAANAAILLPVVEVDLVMSLLDKVTVTTTRRATRTGS
jgi:1-phosphofructokinase family hexose kinase